MNISILLITRKEDENLDLIANILHSIAMLNDKLFEVRRRKLVCHRFTRPVRC